ncbi:MAG TPA: PfkB family carbohydrate kinase [Acidobacteriaceae bacterium]|nr:PfkB family carbohydrate kinase [Acidobacteriaceae bacterium]
MIAENAAPGAKRVVGIGELLWDLLPSGAQLGGAVSNCAVIAGLMGEDAVCASRVGADDLGGRARARLSSMPLDLSCLQTDASHPTGTVSVAFEAGQPKYEIHAPAAWDFLELTEQWGALAEHADAICFGTLAQRAPVSAKTIAGFLDRSSPRCVRVFDVNLRAPFYSVEVVERSLQRATILKMNDAEVPEILRLLGIESAEAGSLDASLLHGARILLRNFPIRLVSITIGAHGSLLVTPRESDRHPGVQTRVADTVGAGDAFTAALVYGYLRDAPLAALNESANRWGAWVASQPGAMPAGPPPWAQPSLSAGLR